MSPVSATNRKTTRLFSAFVPAGTLHRASLARAIAGGMVLACASLFVCGCEEETGGFVLPDVSMQDSGLNDGSTRDGSTMDGSRDAAIDGNLPNDGSLGDSSTNDGSLGDASMNDGSVEDGSIERNPILAAMSASRERSFRYSCGCECDWTGCSVDQCTADSTPSFDRSACAIADFEARNQNDRDALDRYFACLLEGYRVHEQCTNSIVSCDEDRVRTCSSDRSAAELNCANLADPTILSSFNSAVDSCLIGTGTLCAETSLPINQTISTTTERAGDDFASSCGGQGSPDRSWTFTPSVGGVLEINATSNGPSPIVSLFNACGTERVQIGCEQTIGRQVSFRATLRANTTYVVVLDAASPTRVSMNVNFIADDVCESVGVPDVNGSLRFTGNTLAAQDSYQSPDCGGYSAPDLTHTWTAATTGYYRIDTSGSSFDTALQIRYSCNVGEVEESCAAVDSTSVPIGDNAAMTVRATAGTTRVIVVDGQTAGQSGTYALNITRIPDDACPVEQLTGTTATRIGNIRGFLNDFTPSCAPFSSSGNDVAYSFQAPSAGTYEFAVTSSDFLAMVALRSACVSGVEHSCNARSPSADVSVPAFTTKSMNAGETVIVVVDGGGSPTSGAYELTIRRQN